MKDIAEWLASLDLGEYAQRFAENAIDLSVIRDLTENDLEELGVLLGHRRKMLRAIAELQGEAASKPQTSAEPGRDRAERRDRKSTRLNSSHSQISYAGFCLEKKSMLASCILDRGLEFRGTD